MQAIAGIPYFYRRFGYEMAVWMGAGRRLFARDLPARPPDGPYSLRPATTADAPFPSALDLRSSRRYLLSSPRDAPTWRYEVAGRDPDSDESARVQILERPAGEPVGYVCHAESSPPEPYASTPTSWPKASPGWRPTGSC
jgi:hypothetical protein